MIEFLKSLLFVRKCLFCGEVLTDSREDVFCPKCRLEYEKLKRHMFSICGKPHMLCGCMPKSVYGRISHAVHLFAYGDPQSKILIFSLKRRDYKPLQHFLGLELAERLGELSDYAITYAPRKPKSVREYGFDQAKTLARAIAEEKGIPFVEIFSHAHFSKLQKELGAEARVENAEKSYRLRKHFVRECENLIIIDDVMTTGSTMATLASLAKEAGYGRIVVACVALTTYEKETL